MRFNILQLALFYRASNNNCRADWATALDESFTCVLPITPYRSFPSTEVVSGQRVIAGIDAMMTDVASLGLLVETIGRYRLSERRVQVQHYAGPEDIIMHGGVLSCRWMLRTVNAVACGALCECHCQGMLRARFSPAHKLSHLELAFDVMGFMQQLQRASGLDAFRVIPNTVSMAQAPSEEARCITMAETPHLIVYVSPAWCRVCGYTAEEVRGRNARMLQGAMTDQDAVSGFMLKVGRRQCCSMEVCNYTKGGVPFTNYMTAYPLTTDGRVTHFMSTIKPSTWVVPPVAAFIVAPVAPAPIASVAPAIPSPALTAFRAQAQI